MNQYEVMKKVINDNANVVQDLWEMMKIKNLIILELEDVIKKLDGGPEIYSICKNFGHGVTKDKDVLAALKKWNEELP